MKNNTLTTPDLSISSPSQPSNEGELAVIYCRVSSTQQGTEGTSIQTQLQECEKYCSEHGYRILQRYSGVNESGLEIDRHEFNKVRELIRRKDIDVVVINDLDRLRRDPVIGVLLFEELEKYGVRLEAVKEDIDNSDIGKLIMYIKGYASKLEVEKIKERTDRGKKARIRDHGLPQRFHHIFGYSWEGKRKMKEPATEPVRLVPNYNYNTAKYIFDQALAGMSYDGIINHLAAQDIKSPNGCDRWSKMTIASMLQNPVYQGTYCASKTRSRVPEGRSSGKRKSSQQRLSPDEWVPIPGIVVEKPIISPEQGEYLKYKITQRIKLASRNGRRYYLLRGLVLCGTHQGIDGAPRVYQGQPHHKGWRYVCPVKGCEHRHLDGPSLEYGVSMLVASIFRLEFEELSKKVFNTSQNMATSEQLQAEMEKLTKKESQMINLMVMTEDRYMSGEINSEVYQGLKVKYEQQRLHNKKKQDETLDRIRALTRQKEAEKALANIKKEAEGTLSRITRELDLKTGTRSQETLEALRKIFESVNLKVKVLSLSSIRSGSNEDEPHNPNKVLVPMLAGKKYFPVEMNIDIPIGLDKEEAIGSRNTAFAGHYPPHLIDRMPR